jgi:uncharacterized membrane protein YtjA (UPF0391 family)
MVGGLLSIALQLLSGAFRLELSDPITLPKPCFAFPIASCASPIEHGTICSVLAYSTDTIAREPDMLHLVITLLVIGLIAALLGFGGIAGTAVGLAKIVFVVALVLLVASLIFGGMRGSFGRRL